ncbi:MAG: sensor histidine kinase [Crocinitomicaceae bacterium]
MLLFKVPDTNFSDAYDIARFKLTWRICFFMTVTLALLGTALLFLDHPVNGPTFIGFGMVLLFLLVMYKTRKYLAVAFSFTILGLFMCSFTLLAFPDQYHFVDTMWMMIITLYAFFTLGKFWGVITLSVNTVSIVVFVLFVLNKSLSLVGELSQGENIALAVNFAMCSIIIAYLIFQFVRTIENAEKGYKHANEELLRKNKEVAIQNDEKTVMLKEIHHRVKNNLQVITSLLRLQSNEHEDEKSRDQFTETIHRVSSMALIHEKMYQSETLANINLESYLNDLAEDLISSYSVDKPIKVEINCEINYVAPKSLVSYALIFNELISNSLKHGFKNQSSGQISIHIFLDEQGNLVWKYEDNGNWIIPMKETSFGKELIDDLVMQLDGNYSLDTSGKTIYHFVFPNPFD